MADQGEASSPLTLWRNAPSNSRSIYFGGGYFEWIEMIDEPEFEQARHRIQSLWLQVPETLRAEYEARLRSKRSTDFDSAYCEMWYRRELETGGLQCHQPRNTNTGSLPDWKIMVAGDVTAIAECYLRGQPESQSRNEFVRRRWFDDTFRRLRNKHARLSIHDEVCGAGQPIARKLARFIDDLVEGSSSIDQTKVYQDVGRYRYDDSDSGWSIEFTLRIRNSTKVRAVPQLLSSQCGGATWSQGKQYLEEALARKSRQHSNTLPVVICIGWNFWKHEPEFEEICEVVFKKSSALTSRNVCGVFWAQNVNPWNANAQAPIFLHWGTEAGASLRNSWKGKSVDVLSHECWEK